MNVEVLVEVLVEVEVQVKVQVEVKAEAAGAGGGRLVETEATRCAAPQKSRVTFAESVLRTRTYSDQLDVPGYLGSTVKQRGDD